MKVYTLDEANELLPTVRQIVIKIMMLRGYSNQFRKAAQSAATAAQAGGGGMRSGSKYVTSLYELGKLTTELDQMGVQLKDYDRGLVDFPFLRNGKLALLCWQPDDGDEILWWHELDSGFAGRRPL